MDFLAVATLLNSAYKPAGVDLDESADTVRERAQTALVIVAELFGIVVATVTLAGAGSKFGHMASGGQVQASRIAVDPAFQNHGVGSQMLHAVIDSCRQRGIQSIVGMSLESMPVAHGLYEGLGARPAPIAGGNARTYTLNLTEKTVS